MAEFILEEPEEGYVPDGGNRREFKLLPANRNWRVEVLDVEAGDSPWWIDKNDESLGKKPWVNFKFKIVDDGTLSEEDKEDYLGNWVFGNTPQEFKNHPDCKLRQWTTAILGVDELPAGFKFDTDYLIGCVATIRVYHNTKGDKTYVNVADVMPAVDDAGAEALEVF